MNDVACAGPRAGGLIIASGGLCAEGGTTPTSAEHSALRAELDEIEAECERAHAAELTDDALEVIVDNIDARLARVRAALNA